MNVQLYKLCWIKIDKMGLKASFSVTNFYNSITYKLIPIDTYEFLSGAKQHNYFWGGDLIVPQSPISAYNICEEVLYKVPTPN